MNNNLILSNGYYTTIVAVSILKDLGILKNNGNNTYLISYFKQISKSYNQNIKLSKKAFGIKHIVNYINICNKKTINEQKQAISLGNNIHNILIPINSSSKKWYKLLKNIYPDAKFIFYEEGLLSYVKPIVDIKLRKIINNNICFYNDFNNKILNFIKPYINPSSFNIIKINTFNKIIVTLRNLIDIDLFNLDLKNSKNVLILPQYYYANKKYYNNKKLNEYLNITQNLLNNGYKVLFKEHPKTNQYIFNFIQKKLGKSNNLINLTDLKDYPIELFLNELHLDFIFSVYSTTLLSGSSKIFNIPCFTSYKMIKQRYNLFSIYPSLSCYIIKENYPDINAFLQYYRKHSKTYYNKFIKNIKTNKAKINLFTLLINICKNS